MKTIKARWLRHVLNWWPPYLCSGIKVLTLADDWTHAKTRLRLRWYNRNYVNTHYGGSLFSMADPFCMLLLLHRMGRDYAVWDKKAEIKFIKAVRQEVFAEFRVTNEQIAEFKSRLESAEKIEPQFEIDIMDGEGALVAKVWKTVHISRKSRPDRPA